MYTRADYGTLLSWGREEGFCDEKRLYPTNVYREAPPSAFVDLGNRLSAFFSFWNLIMMGLGWEREMVFRFF